MGDVTVPPIDGETARILRLVDESVNLVTNFCVAKGRNRLERQVCLSDRLWWPDESRNSEQRKFQQAFVYRMKKEGSRLVQQVQSRGLVAEKNPKLFPTPMHPRQFTGRGLEKRPQFRPHLFNVVFQHLRKRLV